MGIHLNIGNQEVSYNTIKNFGTKDSPWGSDGGAIERPSLLSDPLTESI